MKSKEPQSRSAGGRIPMRVNRKLSPQARNSFADTARSATETKGTGQ